MKRGDLAGLRSVWAPTSHGTRPVGDRGLLGARVARLLVAVGHGHCTSLASPDLTRPRWPRPAYRPPAVAFRGRRTTVGQHGDSVGGSAALGEAVGGVDLGVERAGGGPAVVFARIGGHQRCTGCRSSGGLRPCFCCRWRRRWQRPTPRGRWCRSGPGHPLRGDAPPAGPLKTGPLDRISPGCDGARTASPPRGAVLRRTGRTPTLRRRHRTDLEAVPASVAIPGGSRQAIVTSQPPGLRRLPQPQALRGRRRGDWRCDVSPAPNCRSPPTAPGADRPGGVQPTAARWRHDPGLASAASPGGGRRRHGAGNRLVKATVRTAAVTHDGSHALSRTANRWRG